MKFRNPWIDPRIEKVQPAQLLAYLGARKWHETPAMHASMQAFRDDGGHGDVLVPKATGYDRYVQDIIDAVTMLAKSEDRFAGDVLSDLLAQPLSEASAPLAVTADKGDSLVLPANR